MSLKEPATTCKNLQELVGAHRSPKKPAAAGRSLKNLAGTGRSQQVLLAGA